MHDAADGAAAIRLQAGLAFAVIDGKALLVGAFAAISSGKILQGGAPGKDGLAQNIAAMAHKLIKTDSF